MTLHIPLPRSEPGPSRSSSSLASEDVRIEKLREVVMAVRSARRIVVICGAGVSTAADIPDFRSAGGLYSGTGKGKGKGKETIKDLFHVKCLSSPTLLAAHNRLINELASMSFTAHPTFFHRYLANLNEQGRLLRVYTQNIDGLEEKAGLDTGIPPKSPSPRKKSSMTIDSPDSPKLKPTPTPRAIPLHGTLSTLVCTLCHSTLPLLPQLPLPATALVCPECDLADSIRSALSERRRSTGRLRPNIVLYGEEHPHGDLIGRVVERDLKGTGGGLKEGKVDFLLVAGTSLSIPGVKRIVKEMSKAVHPGPNGKGKGKGIRSVLVNDEMPRGDWSDRFDVWVEGDVQEFVKNYLDNPDFIGPATPRKRKQIMPDTPTSLAGTKSTGVHVPAKVKVPSSSDFATPPRKASTWLPTPRDTPPSPSDAKRRKVALSPSAYAHVPLPLPLPLSTSEPAVRRAFDGSLTPISDEGGREETNPFLDLA